MSLTYIITSVFGNMELTQNNMEKYLNHYLRRGDTLEGDSDMLLLGACGCP
jgi:hypothetical protein